MIDLANTIQNQDTIGNAVRYQSPISRNKIHKYSGRKLYIEPTPLQYIQSLNGYDQVRVCRGIEELASTPSPLDGAVNTQRPNFFKAKEQTSVAFNFLIKYQLTSEVVIISDVHLNEKEFGEKTNPKDEKACLYNVTKIGSSTLHKNISLEEADDLSSAWLLGDPTVEVKTEVAAVNGMLNNLIKASWLMGVHAEHAYPNDEIKNYTLFHNPSVSALPDFYESVRDNLGITTENARHLASVLADIQRKGKPVKWVVHSQGGIIFKQAVSYHLRKNPGQMLDKNSVVFHSGGNNKKETEKLLAQAGIRKNAEDKDNPFDLVPNLAGRNNLRPSSVRRSLQFWRKVKGSDTSNVVESPHTLPYISLEAYHHFLTLAGDAKSAARVQRYMDKLANP